MSVIQISDFLDGLARGQAAVACATAYVEAEADPKLPGRTAYRISGQMRDAVQGAIDARMREAEERGGFAHFIGPHRDGDGYLALGEVVIADGQP